jgi:hypothetical protein
MSRIRPALPVKLFCGLLTGDADLLRRARLSQLVLASTKDRSHRVHLDAGICAEVTLQLAHGAWQVLPWTGPDYRRPECHAFFRGVRDTLREQRRTTTPPSTVKREDA